MHSSDTILYEFPCSEKIRFYLRLEALKKRFDWYLAQESSVAHQAAISALFDLSDVAARSDLKNELLKELLQQRRTLETLPADAVIHGEPAAALLREIASAAHEVSLVVGRTGQTIRDNEWLQIVRNRQQLPGGTCEFDLPQLHFWLSRPADKRREELRHLASSLTPVTRAAEIILERLRAGTEAMLLTADQGMLQMPVSGRSYLLARIWMPAESPLIPEVSANKYTLWIRFSQQDARRRLHVARETFSFRLGLCS